MERALKGTKTGLVFGQLRLSSSQADSNQLDTHYKQLSLKTLMEETKPGGYGRKSNRICLHMMNHYKLFIPEEPGTPCEADLSIQLSFIVRTLLIETMMEKMNQ